LIGKQKYLESLSWQGGGVERWIYPPWRPNINHNPKLDENVELNTLITLLNYLKPLCSAAEFNSLCLFLTLERLEDHPEYADWSVAAGRYNCCSNLLKLILDTFHQQSTSISSQKYILMQLVSSSIENVVDRDTQQQFRNDMVTTESGARAVHLKSMDTVASILAKQNHRLTWGNEVKIHTRSLTSQHPSILYKDWINANCQSATVTPRNEIINRQNLGEADPRLKSSIDFANTVPRPSAGEKLSAASIAFSEEDPFASTSPELVSEFNHSVPGSLSSRPTSSQLSYAESKKAMPWAVEVSGNYEPRETTPNTSNSRKSLHSRDSQSGYRSSSSATHDPSYGRQSLQGSTRRNQSRDAVDSEHDTAAAKRIASDLRTSHGKMPGLTSPYSSQDISTQLEAEPRSSRGSSINAAREDFVSKVVHSTRKGVLWDEPCPLRCVSVLDENSMDGSVTIAVGTNAKAVHMLKFCPRDLDVLAEETFRGAAATGTEIFDSDGIVQDLTKHVEHVHTFEKVHNGSVYAIDYDRGSSTLVTASNDKTVRVIKTNTRQLCSAMKGHTGTIRVVKFSPKSNRGQGAVLAASAGAGDFRPRLWDIQAECCQRILTEHKSTIHGLVWLNDNVLITGCEDGILIGHDIRDRSPMWSFSLSDLLQRSGSHNVVGRSVCALEYIPLLSSPVSPMSTPPPGGFVAPPLNNVLAIGCLGGSVTFVQADSPPTKISLDMASAHNDDVRTLLALPEYHGMHRHGQLVFSASYDSTANLWSCNAAQRRIDPVLRCSNRANLRGGHSDKVLSAAALQSTPSILTSGADGRIVLWNLPV
jgi:WD40 repeat protein